jgi:hypothetical protein
MFKLLKYIENEIKLTKYEIYRILVNISLK